ncbi:cytochrome c5 family protein [Spongiibacter nanhainus]|uniref:Cytochrome c5 family protein n=1 Tax=Spongiibacter nanhainus TaxID=2794344 RepID=A0A7T4QYZ0_9GAMM|nr:c-type cytochrome [Spongiibacter nanhainus]QQD17264.1 cytochrome c5 family protein [Spongiibacter nanhainus]
MRNIIILLLFVTVVAACSSETPTANATATTKTPVVPADPVLAELYAATCQSCHSNGIGNAPLTGDQAAWQPRLAKGMDTLLTHTITGFGGMPPLGSCSDCSEEDFVALITFMSTPAGDQP